MLMAVWERFIKSVSGDNEAVTCMRIVKNQKVSTLWISGVFRM